MGKTLSLTAVATVIERLSFNDMAMRNSEKRSTMTNATLLFWVDMGNCSKSMATNSNGWWALILMVGGYIGWEETLYNWQCVHDKQMSFAIFVNDGYQNKLETISINLCIPMCANCVCVW